MKKTIFALMFAFTLYTATVTPTYAIYCANCSTIVQQMIEYIMQGFQYAKETISASTNTITATQQTLDTVNNKVLIPMRDAMTVATLMKSSTNIQNMVAGALGTDPLLIRNPDQYFRTKAQQSVQASLGNVSTLPGVYNKSVLSALISSNRNTYADNKTRLAAAGQSYLPSIIQKKVCDDTMLTKLATEDLQAGAEVSVDPSAVVDRKRELNKALCSDDPTKNPGLASTLMKLYQQRPDLGGWDAWLAMTGGDNSYNQAARLQQVMAEQARQAAEQAKNDYNLGGGIKSLTDCTERASTTIYGTSYGQEGGADAVDNTAQAPCVSETIRQTSSAIRDAYNQALRIPTDLNLAGFGKGAGSLISTAFTSLNLIQGITNGMDSLTGGSGGGGVVIASNRAIVTNSVSAPVQDLAHNPSSKNTLVGPPIQQLNGILAGLSTLETTDRNYLSSIASYQGQLDSIKSCYDGLIAVHPEVQNNQQAVTALSFYKTTTTANNSLISAINLEISKIATTTALTTNTINKINASNSSEEIASLFNSYQNQVDSNKLPDVTTPAVREGEYVNFKSTVTQSTAEGGSIYQYKNECSSIQQSYYSSQDTGGTGGL